MLIGCCDFVFHVEILQNPTPQYEDGSRLSNHNRPVFTVAFDFDFYHGGG